MKANGKTASVMAKVRAITKTARFVMKANGKMTRTTAKGRSIMKTASFIINRRRHRL